MGLNPVPLFIHSTCYNMRLDIKVLATADMLKYKPDQFIHIFGLAIDCNKIPAYLLFFNLLLVFLALLLHLRHLVERVDLRLVRLRVVVPVLRQRAVLRPFWDVIVSSRLEFENFSEKRRKPVKLRGDDGLLELAGVLAGRRLANFWMI